jgi:LPS export ABC transporter protein LptC
MTNQDTTLTRAVVKLSAARNENYENMRFRYQVFPEGMRLEFYDDEGQMNIIEADFAMVYTDTNLIELKGNVVLTSHDGKKLEAPQMYYDRANNWIFTESSFRYTNPEDGTIMMGKGMDFDRNFTKVQAQRTDGVIVIKEEES